jgi:hypothetical protein
LFHKIIISVLTVALIMAPIAAGAAVKMPENDQMVMAGSTMSFAEHEECHKVEESKCCETECGCCVAHFFPLATSMMDSSPFAQPRNILRQVDPDDPAAERLIRPPITI